MAYADQQMSGNKITALIIVAILHIALGYALVTGLAYSAIKKIADRVATVDIEKEKPKEEPPPPPPDKPVTPPPPVAPVPPISFERPAPNIAVVNSIPPPAPPVAIAIPVPAAPPAAPPPPSFTPKGAAPKGRPGDWVTTNDYPSRALNENRAGTTSFRLSVGPDGRATGCDITGSSGSPDLDAATCSNLMRRARFTPATDGEGKPVSGSYSNRTRWEIPKE